MERRRAILKRHAALKADREPFMRMWRSVSRQFAPMLARFDDSGRRKAVERNDLMNSAPIRDGRILAAGMMTSITSPSRRWFKLTPQGKFTPDSSSSEGRAWLEDVENVLFQIFARSNIYSALSQCYRECGVFGVSAFFVEEDDEDVVRAYTLPVGSYCLASSSRRTVDTVYREVWMTTAQMVERFGLDRCSRHVVDLYSQGDMDTEHKVVHVVQPKAGHVSGSYLSKPYESLWLEASSEAEGFLKESGYEEFPVMAPRWTVVSGDSYGVDSPAMISLGDAKLLQQLEKTSAKLMENGAEPALIASTTLRNQPISQQAGRVTYADSATGAPAAAPIQVPAPHWISILQEKIKLVEEKIAGNFFVDLFLGMSESDRREMTAEEVRARQQEKMLQLGPVLERLNDELLDPLIERVFSIASRKGLVPPVPEGMDGDTVKVEYLSILTQAQKTVGVSAVQQFVSSVAQMSQVNPEVLDKVDWDQVVDDLAEMYGTPPRELLDDMEVDRIRNDRRQAQETANRTAIESEQAQQALALSKAKLGQDSALDAVLRQSGPVAEAGA